VQALQQLQEHVAPGGHVVVHVMQHMRFQVDQGWEPGGVDIYRWARSCVYEVLEGW
jgi:hypothetical protein